MTVRAKRHSIPLICMEWKERRTEEEWYEFYRDDFDDAAIGAGWTKHNDDANRTIVEAGDVLTIHIDGSFDARWISGVNEAPKLYRDVPTLPFEAIIKMPAFVLADRTDCGIFIGHYDGDWDNEKFAYKFEKKNVTGGHYIQVNRIFAMGQSTGVTMEAGSQQYAVMDESGVLWFRICVNAVGGVSFFVSDNDGTSWHQMTKAAGPPHVWSGFFDSGMQIGPLAVATAHVGSVDAKFDYFLINKLHEVGEWTTNEECISFQDVRSPDRVYAGRIKSLSPLKRALDDKTGLYKIADMNMVLVNNDRYYSERAAGAILKNQEVNVYHAFTEDPEVNRTLLMKMFIEDHSLKGTEFFVKMRDSTQKYFSKSIPANVCTKEDFPDIHSDHVGRMMPEVLGECVVDMTHEHPGAIEAVHVSTIPPYQYLLSSGVLNAVTAVYVDDVLWAPANYAFIPGTPSLLNLASDEGDSRLTFDAEGYSIPAWDSAAGYVQNLVYIIEYLLHYLMDMPFSLIDQASFDDLATYLGDKGFGEIGYLILQEQQDAMEVLRQLLFSGKIKGYVARGGQFKVDIKNINDFAITSLDSHLFTQTDLLRPPDKPWNLMDAINTVNVRNGYIPWQRLWLSAAADFMENEMDGIMEGDIPIRDRDRGNRGIIIGG